MSHHGMVVEFRETKWKLPWTNAFLVENINSKVVRDFNAFDIPIAFLVDLQAILSQREMHYRQTTSG